LSKGIILIFWKEINNFVSPDDIYEKFSWNWNFDAQRGNPFSLRSSGRIPPVLARLDET